MVYGSCRPGVDAECVVHFLTLGYHEADAVFGEVGAVHGHGLGPCMDADGYEVCVAVGVVLRGQLGHGVVGVGTVEAPLTGEVHKQDVALRHHLVLEYEPVVGRDVTRGQRHG